MSSALSHGLADAATSPCMSGLSLSLIADITELVGFAIAIVGFGLTLWKLRAVKTEVREALMRANLRQLISQAATAARLAQETRSLSRDRLWTRAIDRGEQLRMILSAIIDDRALTDTERQHLATDVDDVALVVRQCERGPGNDQYVLPSSATVSLDRLMSRLARMEGRLRNTMTEFPNA
jgi:hypothetical protein